MDTPVVTVSPRKKTPLPEEEVVVTRALDGRITFWGPGAEKAFGYTAEDTVGKHVSLIIPFDWQDEEYQVIDRLRGGLSEVENFRTVRRTKAGYLVDVTVNVRLDHDGTGQVVGARKVYTDISPRERLAQPMFENIGGREAMADAVNRLTARLQADARIKPYFEGLALDDVKRYQAEFLSVALGGPRVEREDPCLQFSLAAEHFEIVSKHLELVLREMRVAPELVDAAMGILKESRAATPAA